MAGLASNPQGFLTEKGVNLMLRRVTQVFTDEACSAVPYRSSPLDGAQPSAALELVISQDSYLEDVTIRMDVHRHASLIEPFFRLAD